MLIIQITKLLANGRYDFSFLCKKTEGTTEKAPLRFFNAFSNLINHIICQGTLPLLSQNRCLD